MIVGHHALHMNGAHWLVVTEGLFLLVVLVPIVAALATYPARSLRGRRRSVVPSPRALGSRFDRRPSSNAPADVREHALQARALQGGAR